MRLSKGTVNDGGTVTPSRCHTVSRRGCAPAVLSAHTALSTAALCFTLLPAGPAASLSVFSASWLPLLLWSRGSEPSRPVQRPSVMQSTLSLQLPPMQTLF